MDNDNQIIYRRATADDLELLSRTRVEFMSANHSDLSDEDKAALYEANKVYLPQFYR